MKAFRRPLTLVFAAGLLCFPAWSTAEISAFGENGTVKPRSGSPASSESSYAETLTISLEDLVIEEKTVFTNGIPARERIVFSDGNIDVETYPGFHTDYESDGITDLRLDLRSAEIYGPVAEGVIPEPAYAGWLMGFAAFGVLLLRYSCSRRDRSKNR